MATKAEMNKTITSVREDLAMARRHMAKNQWPDVERWLEYAARELDLLRDTIVAAGIASFE